MWEVKNESLVMVTLPVCPCDCVISVPTLSPLLAFVYFWASTPFQEKNKALKHPQHPCLHHSSDRHTHKADCFVRSRGTLFLLRTHARTHTAIIVKQTGKRRAEAHLTWQLCLSPRMTLQQFTHIRKMLCANSRELTHFIGSLGSIQSRSVMSHFEIPPPHKWT